MSDSDLIENGSQFTQPNEGVQVIQQDEKVRAEIVQDMMDYERSLTPEERAKNEARSATAGIITGLLDLPSVASNKEYWVSQIQKKADELAQNPLNTAEAQRYLALERAVLQRAFELPNLAETEKQALLQRANTHQEIKKLLAERGASIDIPAVVVQQSKVVEEEVQEPIEADSDNPSEEDRKYAYHTTPLVNTPSIAFFGLLPSGAHSKEAETIYWTGVESSFKQDLMLRLNIYNAPKEPADKDPFEWYRQNNEPFDTFSISSHRPVPVKSLQYSLDDGRHWRSGLQWFAKSSK